MGVFVAGWYYSDQIIRPARHVPLESGLAVVAVSDSTITLAGSQIARAGRRWFLEWPGGFGEAGDLLASDGARVTRRLRALNGRPPVGTGVDLGAYLHRGDPRSADGLAFDTVRIARNPAWFIPGARDTWVVVVHGMAAGRGEALRVLPAMSQLGLPMLVISYRNDPDGLPSPDRLCHLGASEWKDLQAAVRYALHHGARRVVLLGYSMGGSIVTDFLDQSVLARAVAGVILDAPVLDWDAAVQAAARRRRVPALLTSVAEGLVARRIQFDWKGREGKAVPAQFRVPVLLFHGTADVTVPIAGSESLAAALGSQVTFVRTAGAGHVQSWNFDPAGYERALRGWLARVTD